MILPNLDLAPNPYTFFLEITGNMIQLTHALGVDQPPVFPRHLLLWIWNTLLQRPTWKTTPLNARCHAQCIKRVACLCLQPQRHGEADPVADLPVFPCPYSGVGLKQPGRIMPNRWGFERKKAAQELTNLWHYKQNIRPILV